MFTPPAHWHTVNLTHRILDGHWSECLEFMQGVHEYCYSTIGDQINGWNYDIVPACGLQDRRLVYYIENPDLALMFRLRFL